MTAYHWALLCGGCSGLIAASCFAAYIARNSKVPPNRFPAIDGLRGYLALFVAIYHFVLWLQMLKLGTGWDHPSEPWLDFLGPGAVNLFFMTTGFVFYPKVLTGFARVDWRYLYVARVFRLYPMVLFSITTICTIALFNSGFRFQQSFYGFLRSLAAWLTFWDEPALLGFEDSSLFNAHVLWSLRYEGLFYLFVLPFSAGVMDLARHLHYRSASVPLILVVFGACARLLIPTEPFLRFVPLFAVGMVAYEIQTYKRLRILAATRSASALAISLFGLGVFSTGPARFVAHSALFVMLGAGTDIFGLLKSKAARVLGDCSYGVYLLHGTVIALLFSYALKATNLPTPAICFLLPLLLPILVALTALTYWGLERPFMRLGRQLSKTSDFNAGSQKDCTDTNSR